MKGSMFWIFVFGLSLAALAHGQTATTPAPVVMGRGTPNYVPIWTSSSTIGNSGIFESAGNIVTSENFTAGAISGQITAAPGVAAQGVNCPLWHPRRAESARRHKPI